MSNPLPFEHVIGSSALEKPYLPLMAAVESGKIPRSKTQLRKLAALVGKGFRASVRPGAATTDSASLQLASGLLPNTYPGVSRAGILNLGREVVSVDHVSLESWGTSMIINPTSREAIDPEGHIKHSGAVLMTNSEGVMKVLGLVIDLSENPWTLGSLRRSRGELLVGNLAIVRTAYDSPLYEIKDDWGNGQELAVEVRHFVRIEKPAALMP